MRWRTGLEAAGWVVFLTCATTTPRGGPEAPKLSRAKLNSGGRERSFAYFRPEAPGLLPLVLALHGRLGDGAGQDKLSHLSSLARREGFLLVLPDGYSRSWHDARGAGPAAEAGVDDVAFLSELIDHAVKELGADPKRVFVTGMSNGAFMSNVLACRLSDKVAAIGAVTGGVSANLARDCKPSRPVSVALVMGTEDPLVPYGGGKLARDRGEILSARDSAKWWAAAFGCAEEAERSELPDLDPQDGTKTSLERWSGCREGAEVRLYTVEGGGHTWPKGWPYLGEWAVGRVAQDFDASEELWKFFAR